MPILTISPSKQDVTLYFLIVGYMVSALITSKGQITIPKAVRDSLGLNPGDRVAFEMHGSSEVVLKPLTKSLDEVFGKFSNPRITQESVKEMNQGIANRMRKSSL
jgi:antitoxin PrlF